MNKTPAFWDSSALVPLCVQESTSRLVHSYLRKFTPVVWWGSSVEVHSAIRRLQRMDKLGGAEANGAVARLTILINGWRDILPTDSLRDLAAQMLATHDLRAADAFQLAAALTWSQHRPARRNFISADLRLCNAAQALGFSVVELSVSAQ